MSSGMIGFDFLMILQAIALGAIIVVSYVYNIRAGLIPAAVYVLSSLILMTRGPKGLMFLSTVLVVLGGLYLAKLLEKYIHSKLALLVATAAIIVVINHLLNVFYISIVHLGFFYFNFGSLLTNLFFSIASTLGCYAIIMKNLSALSRLSGKKEEAQEVQRDTMVDNTTKNKFRNYFSSPSEEFVCALGNSYVENFIADGSMSNGLAVLSDKRIYFKGKCYSRNGKRFIKTNEERIVDVKDVTGTGFIHAKPLWMIVTAICSLVFVVITIATEGFGVESDTAGQLLALLLVGGVASFIVFLVKYFINRRTLFEITFAGGNISFNTAWINQNEINVFQRNIRLVKDTQSDRRVESESKSVAPQGSPSNSSVADELKKYADLLEKDLLSRDEFEQIKAELLAKKKEDNL